MRLITVILIAAFMQVSATTTLAQKISLSKTDAPLKMVLKELRSQSGYNFVYTDNLLQLSRPVDIKISKADLDEALRAIFSKQPLTYSIEYKTIVLKEKKGISMDKTSRDLPLVEEEVQQQNISGVVTDTTGAPLPGVSVQVKGTSQGVSTGSDGRYQIENIPRDAVLVFSFLGYKTREVAWSGQPVVDIVMRQDLTGLDEVVVVGYGVQNKRDLTGSVVRADIESFRESPNVNIIQSLQGTVPGLNIGQVDAAGENPSISIRGRTTINGNQDVLVVLDGVIYTGDLNALNPRDVESIDILKDPSSKAIYGAQAANGVMLITTKKGKSGSRPVFTYSGSFTTQDPSNALTLMNRDEFIRKTYDVDWEMAYEAPDYTQLKPDLNWKDFNTVPALGNAFDHGYDYDWWEAATHPGYINKHDVGMRGRSENLSYFISGGYTKQEGFILNDEMERITGRINLENSILKWLRIGTQSFVSSSDFSGNSPDLGFIARMAPIITPFDENGEYELNPNGSVALNPFLVASADDYDKRNTLFGNFYADLDVPFIEGLHYRLNYGNEYSWQKRYSSNEFENGATGGAYKRNTHRYDWTLDHILSYKKEFADLHRIDITLVAGQRERTYEETVATGSNYNSLRLSFHDLSLATIQEIESGGWKEGYLYQMARLNYNYDSRYLLTTTLRRDGFSGFARNEKIALFPSLALGWVVSEESFMDIKWLDYLKLRISYGANGNLVGRYASLARVNTFPSYVFGDGGSTLIGQKVGNLESPNLTWETTSGINAGIDFLLWNGRIGGSIDYYQTTTDGLLYNVSLPRIAGYNQILTNVGEIYNRGIELDLDYRIVQSNRFQWVANFNFSSNKNRINSLTGLDADEDGEEDDLVASGLFIGESINAIYDYESAGIIQLGEEVPEGFFVGTHRIVDHNGDGRISSDDRIILGRREPAYRFGILNEFTFGNFSLKIFINSIQGGKNGFLSSNTASSFGNQSEQFKANNFWKEYDYWTPRNPDARYPRLDQGAAYQYTFYGDRSFIRLQDISLSYRLDSKIVERIGIQNLKVYLSGKNLQTWTDWVGWDPETGLGLGVNGRPVLKGFSIGLDLTL